jgi:hypothetical protein
MQIGDQEKLHRSIGDLIKERLARLLPSAAVYKATRRNHGAMWVQVDGFAAASCASLSAAQLDAYLSASSYFDRASFVCPCFASTSPQALSGSAQYGPRWLASLHLAMARHGIGSRCRFAAKNPFNSPTFHQGTPYLIDCGIFTNVLGIGN